MTPGSKKGKPTLPNYEAANFAIFSLCFNRIVCNLETRSGRIWVNLRGVGTRPSGDDWTWKTKGVIWIKILGWGFIVTRHYESNDFHTGRMQKGSRNTVSFKKNK